MANETIQIGADVVHVERLCGTAREVRRGKIVRETKTLWVDDIGTKWRKSDGSMVPQYIAPRFIMTPSDFANATGGRAE